MGREEEICSCIPSVIRDRSAAGRLVGAREILTELKGQALREPTHTEAEARFESLLKQTLRENQDIHEMFGRNGVSYYYSDRSMTETYAELLVWKSEDPLWMMAQVVRENSRAQPSPVPVAGFGGPPFDLTPETILECLEGMGRDGEYQDIERTITSAGTVFLYSSRHLDPDYAAMLAEWIDVGQAGNP
jgi:hypothetical protein